MGFEDKSSFLKLFSWKIVVGNCPSKEMSDMSRLIREDNSEK